MDGLRECARCRYLLRSSAKANLESAAISAILVAVGEDDELAPRGETAAAHDASESRTVVTSESSSSYPSQRLSVQSTAIRAGEVLGDRYRVLERLGKGGMGEVHLAEHIAIGRRVAVKTLSGDFRERPELARRFLQEARTASRVRHPNIVDITDFGHTDLGAPFFVMELLEGEELKVLLRREKTLPWDRVCSIGIQICAALTAAHTQGVVHRDMKPDNVFLIRQDDAELVKVLDFGIAKITDEETGDATRTGVLLGTPHYMSPEQAQDDPLDARSDIYSMGVLLFRMVTGRVPFRGKSFMKVLGMHMQQPPPNPSDFAPEGGLSAEGEALILKCLAKDPADRYQSAEALAAALRGTQEASLAPGSVVLPVETSSRSWALIAGLGVVSLGGVFLAWTLLSPPGTHPDEPRDTSRGEHSGEVADVAGELPLSAGQAPLTATATGASTTTSTGDSEGTTSTTGGPEAPALTTPDPDTGRTKTKAKTKAKAKAKSAAPAKASLSSADLSSAAKSVKKALASCTGGLPGMVVKVDVTVSTSGQVTSARAHKPQRGSALGNCVEQAAKRARFPRLVSAQDETVSFRLP